MVVFGKTGDVAEGTVEGTPPTGDVETAALIPDVVAAWTFKEVCSMDAGPLLVVREVP